MILKFWKEKKICDILEVNKVKDEFFELLPSEYFVSSITEDYHPDEVDKVTLTFRGWFNPEDFNQQEN